MLALHLPTLTEVVDEASIVDWRPGFGMPTAPVEPAMEVSRHVDAVPTIDLSDETLIAYRTPTPQEVDSLRGDNLLFEATISDREIRRALADSRPRAFHADSLDVSLADEIESTIAAHADGHATVDDPLTGEMLAERVLADVQRQVDALLEHRLRESLVPVLARIADSLVVEARDLLASNLRGIVVDAVEREIERRQRR